MRRILFFLFLLISIQTIGQSKEDSESFVKKIIEGNGAVLEGLSNDYTISFEKNIMYVTYVFADSFLGNFKVYYQIPLKEIDTVVINETGCCCYIEINLRDGGDKIKSSDWSNFAFTEKYFSFCLRKLVVPYGSDQKLVATLYNLRDLYKSETTKKTFTKSYTSILDEKNGFKDLKIGDDFNKWQPFLSHTNTADGDIRYYYFLGDCCRKLFSYPLECIRVGFKEDKLEVIYLVTPTATVSTKGWVSSEYVGIKSEFSRLFGIEPSDIPSEDNSGKVYSNWCGNNISLMLCYEYMGVKQNGNETVSTGRCTISINKLTSVEEGF